MKTKILLIFFILISPAVKAREPSLRELEKITLKYAGLEGEELNRWKKRIYWSAVLPKVSVGYDQGSDSQINQTLRDSISVSSSGVTIGPPENTLYQNDKIDNGFKIQAVWDLQQLLFNHDLFSLSSEARYRSIVRTQVLEDLHQAYFERKKILSSHAEIKSDPLKLKLEEAEAKIDSLTNGMFSTIIKEEY